VIPELPPKILGKLLQGGVYPESIGKSIMPIRIKIIKLYLAFIFGRLLNLNIDIFSLKFFIEIIVIVNIRSENFHSSKLKLECIRFIGEHFLKFFNEKTSYAFNFLAD
jgi:hypothetical protein